MNRSSYFDFLRGLAIMMVVGIHTFSVVTVDLSHSIDSVLIRQILNCAVPIFLAISGYFLCTKKLDLWDDKKVFWLRQIPKVYIPTMIVSLPYFLLSIYQGNNLIVEVGYMLICGYSVYYFIALIIQYYLLLPIFQRVNWKGGIVCVILSFASILIVTYVNNILCMNLPLIVYAGFFPVWCVFFAMGCYMRKINRNYSLKIFVVLLLFSIVLQYVETYFLYTNYSGGLGIKLSSFIFSIFVIIVLFSSKIENYYKTNLITKFVEYIGSISFAIYLYHMFTILCLGIIGINGIPWLIRWLICLLVTIIVLSFLKHIIPQRIQIYLGL